MKYCSAVIFFIIFQFHVCMTNYAAAYFNYSDVVAQNVFVPCETDEQCQGIQFEGFRCVDNACMCENNLECQKPRLQTVITKIGQKCSTNSSFCSVEHSFCNITGKCDCAANKIGSTDKKKCLNITNYIGLPCEDDVQCTSLNGICLESKCTCLHNMHEKNGICYSTIAIGYTCQKHEECPNFSTCEEDRCTCVDEYIKSANASLCLLKSQNLTSTCFEDIQCSVTLGLGSECFKGRCKCKDIYNFKAKTNKCVVDALLGEECAHHDDCHQPGNEERRLDCFFGECKCKLGYYEYEGYCLSTGHVSNIFILLLALPLIVCLLVP